MQVLNNGHRGILTLSFHKTDTLRLDITLTLNDFSRCVVSRGSFSTVSSVNQNIKRNSKSRMFMKKRGHKCLVVSTMISLVLLMMVLYGTFSSQQPGSSSRWHDSQLLGRPLYKLDLSWPKNPELFTGEVFGVAVNQYDGVVYVAQRGK